MTMHRSYTCLMTYTARGANPVSFDKGSTFTSMTAEACWHVHGLLWHNKTGEPAPSTIHVMWHRLISYEETADLFMYCSSVPGNCYITGVTRTCSRRDVLWGGLQYLPEILSQFSSAYFRPVAHQLRISPTVSCTIQAVSSRCAG